MTLFRAYMLIAGIGAGATLLMDVWLLVLKRLNIPTLDFALIGRWIGHAMRGRWKHASIARSAPVRGELALGWLVHYATGIGFAALLVAVQGTAWLEDPAPWPAVWIGVATVLAPWLVMQPAMGAGIAAARTARPWRNRMRSLANHGVFGIGLYFAAAFFQLAGR
jgi:hypothetical protein